MADGKSATASTVQRIKIGTLRSAPEVLAPGTYRDGDHAIVITERHRVMRVERFGYEDRRCDFFTEGRPGQWGSIAWHVSHYDWSTAERIDPSQALSTSFASWWRRLLAFLFRRRRSTTKALPEARVIEREAPEAQSRETA